MKDKKQNQDLEKEGLDKDPGETRFRLEMNELERKAIIALAISGEDSLAELAMSTGMEEARLEQLLMGMVEKGIISVENGQGQSEASQPTLPPDLPPPPPRPIAPEEEEGKKPDMLAPPPLPEFSLPGPAGEEKEPEEKAEAEPAPAAGETLEDEETGSVSGVRLDEESLSKHFQELKSKNYYQMLELEPDAGIKEVRQVYFDLVYNFHPDRHRRLKDENVLELLADIFHLLTEAYETLRSWKRRKSYDRTIPEFTGARESEEEEALDALFSESADNFSAISEERGDPPGWSFYETAMEAFNVGDYQVADLNFKLAAGMEPDREEYQKGLKKTTEIINKQILEELKREAKKLEEAKRFTEAAIALERAVELDSMNADLRYSLASIRFLKTMDRIKAEEDISWALALNPEHVDALLLYGRILVWKGENQEAIKTFKKVLAIKPGCEKAKQAISLFEKK